MFLFSFGGLVWQTQAEAATFIPGRGWGTGDRLLYRAPFKKTLRCPIALGCGERGVGSEILISHQHNFTKTDGFYMKMIEKNQLWFAGCCEAKPCPLLGNFTMFGFCGLIADVFCSRIIKTIQPGEKIFNGAIAQTCGLKALELGSQQQHMRMKPSQTTFKLSELLCCVHADEVLMRKSSRINGRK